MNNEIRNIIFNLGSLANINEEVNKDELIQMIYNLNAYVTHCEEIIEILEDENENLQEEIKTLYRYTSEKGFELVGDEE